MRRKPLPILIICIILAVILFIPFDREVVVKINAPYFNSYQQLFSPQNWEKWQSDINGIYQTDSSLCKLSTTARGFKIVIPQKSFVVERQSSTGLTVKKSNQNKVLAYRCTIVPDTSGVITFVVITYQTTAIKYLSSLIRGGDLYKADMYDFKKYMEDTKAYYGYYIKTDFLPEKKIVVNRETVAAKAIFTEAAGIQKRLKDYISQNNLKQVAPLMMQYTAKSQDSTQIMMGVPVNKAVKPDHGFLYMEIPATNALMADFSGKYSDKQKVYTALEKYIQDRHLHRKIAPLEIFDGPIPASADEVTMFRIVYPFF